MRSGMSSGAPGSVGGGYWSVKTGSVDTVGQCLFDFGAGMQCPKDRDRNDHGAGQFGRHIGGDAGQPQHVDAQMLSRRSRRLQIGAGVVPQSEIQRVSRDRAAHHLGVAVKLIAYGGTDEIRPVRIETVSGSPDDLSKIVR
jgi:hypothetical protein